MADETRFTDEQLRVLAEINAKVGALDEAPQIREHGRLGADCLRTEYRDLSDVVLAQLMTDVAPYARMFSDELTDRSVVLGALFAFAAIDLVSLELGDTADG
jgi:hypothetical protein